MGEVGWKEALHLFRRNTVYNIITQMQRDSTHFSHIPIMLIMRTHTCNWSFLCIHMRIISAHAIVFQAQIICERLEFLKFVETLPLMHHFTRKGWFLWNALVHVCYFRPVTRILDAENLHRRAVLSIIFFRLHKKRSHIRIISAYIHIIKAGYTHMRLHYLHMQKESGNSIYPLSFSEFNH